MMMMLNTIRRLALIARAKTSAPVAIALGIVIFFVLLYVLFFMPSTTPQPRLCMGKPVKEIPFEELEHLPPPPTPSPPDPSARDPLIPMTGIGMTAHLEHPRSLPHVVWTFWFGGMHKMSPARKRSIRMMRKHLGVPLVLVTEADLHRYNKVEDPMHPIIFAKPPLISGNHIVDYLRAYWMKHYGGGYQDVKPSFYSWKDYFAAFDSDPDLWLIGSRMLMAHHIACDESYLRRLGMEENCTKVKGNWQYLVSDAAWIARPGTPLALEFYSMINGTLNMKWDELKKHPVPSKNAGRCCSIWTRTEDDNYPLRWAEMHGEAFDPIQLRWNKHVRQGVPRWEECEDYT